MYSIADSELTEDDYKRLLEREYEILVEGRVTSEYRSVSFNYDEFSSRK